MLRRKNNLKKCQIAFIYNPKKFQSVNVSSILYISDPLKPYMVLWPSRFGYSRMYSEVENRKLLISIFFLLSDLNCRFSCIIKKILNTNVENIETLINDDCST